jgi:hypothetical protein
LNTRVQEPGSAILQLMVRDMDSVLKNVKANGGTVVSTGGGSSERRNVADCAHA